MNATPHHLQLPPESPLLPRGGLTNAVDFVVGWARANSLWPLVFGTSCCAIEMMATGASHNDWARFGMEVARASPRQADLIILAGTIVEKLGKRLTTLYEQMPEPKYVIAMGACTISGGPFYYDSYTVVKGANRLIPVDVFVPGCPPRPEALLYGIMQLQRMIRDKNLRAQLGRRKIDQSTFTDTWTATATAWNEAEQAKQEGMKEAQAKFKEEHPDHKGYEHKKIAMPKFPEAPRAPAARRGLALPELLRLVRERFPEVAVQGFTMQGIDDPTPAALEQLGPEAVLDLVVPRAHYVELVRYLRDEPRLAFEFLIELTAIDWKQRFEVVVHLQSVVHGHKVFLRVALPHEEHPEIETLCHLHAGANWHERETYDFFGIHFTGHPDLRRLFLEDDFPGHPLRKDFADPTRVVKRPY